MCKGWIIAVERLKKLTKNGEKYHKPRWDLNYSPTPYTSYSEKPCIFSGIESEQTSGAKSSQKDMVSILPFEKNAYIDTVAPVKVPNMPFNKIPTPSDKSKNIRL